MKKETKNFPCGHLRSDYYLVTRKIFSKKLQDIVIKLVKVCAPCMRVCSNKYNKKYKPRKTNRRWKIINGKRVFYNA